MRNKNMSIQTWPFLVSRNQSIDYKTVVAPDFIADAKIRSLLARVTEGDLTDERKANIRWVEVPDDKFTVVFRVVKAKKKDIGESGNEVLKDPFGREIYLVEGLVIRKEPDKLTGKIRKIHLELAHKDMTEKYRKFWHESEISNSKDFSLEEDASSPLLELEKMEPFSLITKPQPLEINRSKIYPSEQSVKGKGSRSSSLAFLVIAIIVLFFIGIWIWKLAGLSLVSFSRQQHLEPKNCLYGPNIPIKFNKDEKDGSKPLKDYQNDPKYKNAKIVLKGILVVEQSDEIKKRLKPKNNAYNDKNDPTISLDGKKLKMEYYPIQSAIDLLRNQKVNGTIYPTIWVNDCNPPKMRTSYK